MHTDDERLRWDNTQVRKYERAASTSVTPTVQKMSAKLVPENVWIRQTLQSQRTIMAALRGHSIFLAVHIVTREPSFIASDAATERQWGDGSIWPQGFPPPSPRNVSHCWLCHPFAPVFRMEAFVHSLVLVFPKRMFYALVVKTKIKWLWWKEWRRVKNLLSPTPSST